MTSSALAVDSTGSAFRLVGFRPRVLQGGAAFAEKTLAPPLREGQTLSHYTDIAAVPEDLRPMMATAMQVVGASVFVLTDAGGARVNAWAVVAPRNETELHIVACGGHNLRAHKHRAWQVLEAITAYSNDLCRVMVVWSIAPAEQHKRTIAGRFGFTTADGCTWTKLVLD